MLFNFYMNYLSWNMISVFGLGDFEKCKTTGNYAVGHRVHYLSNQKKNAVGVFYPVDK